MARYTIYPILGMKTSVPANDPSLFVPMADGFATYDTGGQNFELSTRTRSQTCAKSRGYEAVTTAISSPTACQGIHAIKNHSSTFPNALLEMEEGYIYTFQTSVAASVPLEINPAGVVFSTTNYFTALEFAGQVIVNDGGTTTPYKWDQVFLVGGPPYFNDLTKLVQSGTEYKFRYLESFQNRIFGAYSDQTNGKYEIRWTNALPAYGSLSFPDANQLYKPGTDDITGIKCLGSDTCILYGRDSINEVVYYPGSTTPFGVLTVMHEHGPYDQASLVATPGAHYFYTFNDGFIEYRGGQNYNVISNDIKGTLSTIYSGYESLVQGTFVNPDRVIWSVPLDGSSSRNALLEYNIDSRMWRKTVLAHTLKAIGSCNMIKIDGSSYDRAPQLLFGSTNGTIYAENESLNAAAGSDIDGYRIEPIMDFGNTFRKKLVTEVWFSVVQGGDYSIDLSWRGGDTVKEVLAASWTAIGSLNINSPADPVIYPDTDLTVQRLHQFKWGTNLKNELFEVNKIEFEVVMDGGY